MSTPIDDTPMLSLDDETTEVRTKFVDIEHIISLEKKAAKANAYDRLNVVEKTVLPKLNTDEYLLPWMDDFLPFYKFLKNNEFVGSDGVSYPVDGWTVRSKLPELFSLLNMDLSEKQKLKYGCVSNPELNYDASKNAIPFSKTKQIDYCIQDIMTELIEGTECLSIYEVDEKGLPSKNFKNPLHILDENYRGLIKVSDFVTITTKLGNNLTEEEKEEHDFDNITEERANATFKNITVNDKGLFKYKELIDYYFGTEQDVYDEAKRNEIWSKLVKEAELAISMAEEMAKTTRELSVDGNYVIQEMVDSVCHRDESNGLAFAISAENLEVLRTKFTHAPDFMLRDFVARVNVRDFAARASGVSVTEEIAKATSEVPVDGNSITQEMIDSECYCDELRERDFANAQNSLESEKRLFRSWPAMLQHRVALATNKDLHNRRCGQPMCRYAKEGKD